MLSIVGKGMMLLLTSRDTANRVVVFMWVVFQSYPTKQPLTVIFGTSLTDTMCASVFLRHELQVEILFLIFYNSEAVSKLISPHPSKRLEPGDHYYLFVDFPSAEEAQAAMNALDGQNGPWGGKLKVGRARGDSSKPDERQRWAAARGKEFHSTTETAAAA
jgi:hypothetical protein